jgi:hypothetical protein
MIAENDAHNSWCESFFLMVRSVFAPQISKPHANALVSCERYYTSLSTAALKSANLPLHQQLHHSKLLPPIQQTRKRMQTFRRSHFTAFQTHRRGSTSHAMVSRILRHVQRNGIGRRIHPSCPRNHQSRKSLKTLQQQHMTTGKMRRIRCLSGIGSHHTQLMKLRTIVTAPS